MGRLDVLVYKTPLVDLVQGRGDADGQAQETAWLHGGVQEPGKRLAAGVLKQQNSPTMFPHKL
jgi:hypothetical protein